MTQDLHSIFSQFQSAVQQNSDAPYEVRLRKLKTLKSSIVSNEIALIEAVSKDFGFRSEFDTVLGDIFPSIDMLNYSIRSLKNWMKPSVRHAGLALQPAKVKVVYKPLGLIGIMVPWNFPISLCFSPLIAALSAGNKVLIKMSEETPHTNKVIKEICQVLNKDIAVIEGGVDTAKAFSNLPFDHLLFTGSTETGKKVAQACAKNLTPYTLELGGKSPVIIDKSADLSQAADAIIFGKLLNHGQVCIAPDYVLAEQTIFDKLLEQLQTKLERFLNKNSQTTSIINANHYDRLQHLLDDAKANGAEVYSSDKCINDPTRRILNPVILTNINASMRISKEEIFGPLLPVIPIDTVQTGIEFINELPNPLALYIMSQDNIQTALILKHTQAGGVCINDTIFHHGVASAPFGGVGGSGCGHYHGKEGFLEFSHHQTQMHSFQIFNKAKLISKTRKWFPAILRKLFY